MITVLIKCNKNLMSIRLKPTKFYIVYWGRYINISEKHSIDFVKNANNKCKILNPNYLKFPFQSQKHCKYENIFSTWISKRVNFENIITCISLKITVL